jgi:hypothetical protein
MERLVPRIMEIAGKIKETEGKRRQLARFLREISVELDLIKEVKPHFMNDIRVVGVDGGIVKKSLHGFDCVLARAAAACFHYKNDSTEKVEYFPSRIPVPKADIIEALSDIEWSYFTSIMRLRLESDTAIEVMERIKPDLLLMDGSIVPHYMDRPSKTSALFGNYSEMVGSYMKLYSGSLDSGVMLAGVIEDSRGVSFCNLVKEEILSRIEHKKVPDLQSTLEKTRDTNLLFWVLNKGERSKVFRYTESVKDHPVLKDFEEFGRRVYSFYLKTAQRDRPVRVDFLSSDKDTDAQADRISSMLLAVSGHHSGYGLPAPLIEADNIAKLSESEIENFYSNIISFTGELPGVMRLRREQRPF